MQSGAGLAKAPGVTMRFSLHCSKTAWITLDFAVWVGVARKMPLGVSHRRPGPKAVRRRDESRDASTGLPGDLVRALRWLRAHVEEPVRIARLAEVAGVRPRTLETHFKLFLGTTPLGWVRRMRLSLARQRLLDPDRAETVTGVALASGFGQLGRFALHYREAFGELPSQTLKRARGLPGSGIDEVDDEALRLTWRAFSAAHAVAPRECGAALEDLARAQELAPTYGLAKALAAWCWGQRAAQHFSPTPGEDRAHACRLAAEACALAPDDAMTLMHCSGALALAHRIEEADRQIERALALDPWSPLAWLRRGWISAYLGDRDAALRHFRGMLHLMPLEPLRHTAFIGIGCAHFAAGRYGRAAAWARSGVEASPGSFWGERIVIAAAVHAGARAEARRTTRKLLRRDPDLTVAVARRAWPFPPRFMARLADGLIIAGMPRA
jgi:AraC-like DNA-binding protein